MSAPGKDLRVALIQGETRWHDAVANLAYYGEKVCAFADQADLIVLPETFTSGFTNDIANQAERMQGKTLAAMQAWARDSGAAVCGSVVIAEAERVFNRLLFVQPDGEVTHYDKRHLFRMANEHQRYSAGVQRLVVDVQGWRICPLICYDLRFPVFSRNGFDATRDDMHFDVLLYVANWPSARRGPWRTLLRARAIENLCYVAGVNRVGVDGNQLHYAGDSAVIDFLGEPLVDLGAQEQSVLVKLDAAALAAHRTRFPAWQDADRFEILAPAG
jgi:omega-amidase